ncbi:pimeloyl-ACP methyl ester carboxylesterase [Aeromicrobium panaciterrae]|uniref:Pimeloyl-ACP methyl ester carboxylesterase n=1 Tax=Aeromicrobium panaciterrae TaxID=363861 RepID=A0ABU1ULV0_9ACTN|nr:alpha/beta hydrolase [Aeromicrobium panaciterrae]MDR7086159.1 pimeloyl-ACP methyl ester carboxylesterase [Aeromicrobium panaciterrae]
MTSSGELFASLPSGIDICYETFGNAEDPPLLLIMGMGGPMNWWSVDFCERLAARGFFVIRYDNRDTGRSTKLDQHRVSKSSVYKAYLGRVAPPYGLDDFAEDALGLLDHLGLDRVNMVGVSMGGMIAQTICISHPERVQSLTSIMSTTGKRTVGWQNPRVIPALMSSAGNTIDTYIARSLRASAVIGSPNFPAAEEATRARATETYERGWSASGTVRHMLAVLSATDRTSDLAKLDLPVTVIHGMKDPLVHRSGGKATAAAIPGAEHIEIGGMGHDLPPELYDTFINAIERNTKRSVSS